MDKIRVMKTKNEKTYLLYRKVAMLEDVASLFHLSDHICFPNPPEFVKNLIVYLRPRYIVDGFDVYEIKIMIRI